MIIKLNEHNLQREIARLGVHPASCGIFAAKSKILPLKLTQVRTPAANILKQEMLAAGGDCAVPGSCILNETKYVDAVLLGTVKHYRILARKLAQMPFFGLAQVREELQKFLAAATESSWSGTIPIPKTMIAAAAIVLLGAIPILVIC